MRIKQVDMCCGLVPISDTPTFVLAVERLRVWPRWLVVRLSSRCGRCPSAGRRGRATETGWVGGIARQTEV